MHAAATTPAITCTVLTSGPDSVQSTSLPSIGTFRTPQPISECLRPLIVILSFSRFHWPTDCALLVAPPSSQPYAPAPFQPELFPEAFHVQTQQPHPKLEM